MIVEYDIQSDAISDSLQQVTEMTVVIDTLGGSDDLPLRSLFWASGGDFDAFEEVLTEDATITDFKQLAQEGEARLYRVLYSNDVPEVAAYRAAFSLDGTILHAENDGEGWFVRMRFPDRESIATFRDRCWDAGFDITIRAVYDRQDTAPRHRFELTTPQYETLVTALERGYFSIPRGASLQDIADELGVSSQAASERVRRGMKALVSNTLGSIEQPRSDDSLELEQHD